MKTTLTIALFAAAGTAANAQQLTATSAAPGLVSEQRDAETQGSAQGDLVETALTVQQQTTQDLFFFDDPIFHEIGSTNTFPNATFLEVTSSVSTDMGAMTRTVDVTWQTNDGSAIFGPEFFGPADGIDLLGFELGENNVPNDFVEDPDYVSLAEPFDGDDFLGDFSLFDAAGTEIFAGDFFLTDQGTGFSGVVFINAGGADLGDFNIGGATASITYNIPTPASAALLGLGGLAAARRRR